MVERGDEALAPRRLGHAAVRRKARQDLVLDHVRREVAEAEDPVGPAPELDVGRLDVVERGVLVDPDHGGRRPDGREDRPPEPPHEALELHVGRLDRVRHVLRACVGDDRAAGVVGAIHTVVDDFLADAQLVGRELVLEDQDAPGVAPVPDRRVHVPHALQVQVDLTHDALHVPEAAHRVVGVEVREAHDGASRELLAEAPAVAAVAVSHGETRGVLLDPDVAPGDREDLDGHR